MQIQKQCALEIIHGCYAIDTKTKLSVSTQKTYISLQKMKIKGKPGEIY